MFNQIHHIGWGERCENKPFKTGDHRCREVIPLPNIADQHNNGVQSFEGGVGIPQGHINNGKIAGWNIDDHQRELVGVGVHLRHELIDEFCPLGQCAATDQLLIDHLQHGLCGGLGREVVDGNEGPSIGFEATDERGSSRPQRTCQHDASSRPQFQVGSKQTELLLPPDEFSSIPCLERAG